MAAATVQPQRASLFRHGGCWLLLRCLVGAALSLARVYYYEHGVKQPRNPWHDGPEYITQCPIAPGTNFTYEVQFTTEEGTLWWHAHSDWTRVTVHGAIVILPPERTDGGPYPFTKPDAEEVIVLVFNLRAQLFTHGSAYTTYKVMVEQGKTYLLRIVNAILDVDLFLSVAGHNLTPVGSDASYVKPITSSYIVLSPGQTIDVLLSADRPLGCYYIVGRQYSSNSLSIVDYNHSNVTAILEYRGDYTPSASPPEFPSSTLPIYKGNFAALSFRERIRSLVTGDHPSNVPREVSMRMFVLVSMGVLICPNSSCVGVYGNRMASSMTNFSRMNPTTDILQAYYRQTYRIFILNIDHNFTADDLPLNVSVPTKGRMVKVLNFNESVEIVFQGTNIPDAAETHQMHLHGHSFYVVGSGVGDFDEVNDPKGYNLVDPPYLNTVTVPKSGWAAIRFAANNPGVWFLHCHFEKHLTWGMETVLIVKDGGSASTSILPPPAYMPPCDGEASSLNLVSMV
ncbi:hypothetical protein SAY86_008160 [Trapa natans]|uniref:Laccase n=1 Tax=Trapa natans TaxID=22666 RepID=A0AAN7QAG7_TRANT|nr:hypothetical protein SAY86_008160 [Trapa natans]